MATWSGGCLLQSGEGAVAGPLFEQGATQTKGPLKEWCSCPVEAGREGNSREAGKQQCADS